MRNSTEKSWGPNSTAEAETLIEKEMTKNLILEVRINSCGTWRTIMFAIDVYYLDSNGWPGYACEEVT